MANQRSCDQARKRNAGSKHAPGSALLRDAIESERGTLLKAESLLNCLAISMEYASDRDIAPHYPDVAQVACDLIRQSIDGLDSLTVERLMRHKRIKEETDSSSANQRSLKDCDLSYAERCFSASAFKFWILHTGDSGPSLR
jgi:hypothetical protein